MCIRDRAIVELLYSTAIRASELTGLNREDINFIGRDIVVFGKGKKEREVYLNARSFVHLKEYLENRKDDNEALFVSIRKDVYKRQRKSCRKNIAMT